MANFEYGISNKGCQTVIYKGFEFFRHRVTTGGAIHWRCAKFRTLKCCSFIHTKDDKIIKEPNEHCHAINLFEAAAHKLTNQMKIEMSNSGGDCSVVAESLLSVSEGIKMALPKKASLARRLQRSKAKKLGPTPNSINFEIPENFTEWIIHDSGVHDPERILLIGHRTLLDLLVVNDCWLGDNTFKVVPEIYFQLYSIHVQLDSGIALPCVLALLPVKEERTYVKMLKMLIEKIPQAKPRKIWTDFDVASMKAFSTVFENIEVGGCVFHLSQSIQAKVTEYGLKSLYETNESFAINIKMLIALSLLPEGEVWEAFFELSDLISSLDIYNEQIEQILIYFEQMYVRGPQDQEGTYNPPIFDISMWNRRQSADECVARTTNCVEGWHCGLLSFFQCSNPSLWKFLQNIIKELNLQHGNYLLHLTGKGIPGRLKYVSLKQRVSNIIQNYDSSKRLEFLRNIAYMT